MTGFHFNRTCVFTQEIRMHPRISFLLTTLKKKRKKRDFSTGRNYREDICAFWDGRSYGNTKRNLVVSRVPNCLQSNICVVHVMGKQVAFHLPLYGLSINSIYLLKYCISDLWQTTEQTFDFFPGMVQSALKLVAKLFQQTLKVTVRTCFPWAFHRLSIGWGESSPRSIVRRGDGWKGSMLLVEECVTG